MASENKLHTAAVPLTCAALRTQVRVHGIAQLVATDSSLSELTLTAMGVCSCALVPRAVRGIHASCLVQLGHQQAPLCEQPLVHRCVLRGQAQERRHLVIGEGQLRL